MPPWMTWHLAIELAFVAVLLMVLPRFIRRGLLYGVYVGERDADSELAQAAHRTWYATILAACALAVAVFAAGGAAGAPEIGHAASILLLVAGVLLAYVRAHRVALPLAVAGEPAPEAPLAGAPLGSSVLPLIAMAAALALGGAALLYGIAQYPTLPERIPVHFGGNGLPDGWDDRSPGAALALPLMGIVLGGFTALFAWLIAHGRRSLRDTTDPAAVEAQDRFRLATARFLAAISVAVTGLMSWMGFRQIEVARGARQGLGAAPLVGGLGLAVLSLFGVVYLLARYGQGGAMLEGRTASAPLTDGLADNRKWKLWGSIYVNRADPSIFVEKRFGLGYTINFGNPTAIWLFAGFAVAMVGVTLFALLG